MSQEMAWLGLFAMNLVLILQPWQLALGPKEVFSVPHPNNIIPISNGISFLHLKCSLATQPPPDGQNCTSVARSAVLRASMRSQIRMILYQQ